MPTLNYPFPIFTCLGRKSHPSVAQPRQLHAELFARQRLEVWRVTPEFIVFDRLGMVQPDDERGVDVIQETVEAITDQDRRVPGQFLAFPAIVAGKDQQGCDRRVFAQAKCPLDQILVHGSRTNRSALSG